MGLFNRQNTRPAFTEEQRERARLNRAESRAKKVENEKLKEKIKELEEKISDKDSAARSVERKHKEALEVLQVQNKALKERISAHGELEDKVRDLTKRELLVENREGLVEAQKEGMKEFKDEIKQLREEQDTVAESKYKTGYADGLSDGIRKGTEFSQEDRKMLAQVAMLSAASHTPEAANEIAKSVVRNALPATTRTKNK